MNRPAWTLLLLAGCTARPVRLLPVKSPEPAPPATAQLRAGFGRADITPPPLLALAGNGPDGGVSIGHRQRLYARALLLEDKDGERIAIVTLDMGMPSLLLHRLVAQRIADSTRIGADRLFLAATHTHSGPAHFHDAWRHNDNSSSYGGYDSTVVEFLVERIAGAVRGAQKSLSPARAAWAVDSLWGITRNRSFQAFKQNDRWRASIAAAPVNLPKEQKAIDPTWALLRVDTYDSSTSRYVPAGALSIFAIHGTVVPNTTELYDPDIHGYIERGLERYIDQSNGVAFGLTPKAVHLVANGTEGDVTSNWPANSRCPTPRLLAGRELGGPRAPAVLDQWRSADNAALARCMSSARRFADSAGAVLSAHVQQLFHSLDDKLQPDLRIARAFTTFAFAKGKTPGLCEQPRAGISTLAGAEDEPSRWRDQRLATKTVEEGGDAINRSAKGCHREKAIFGGDRLQGLLAPAGSLPEVAQLAVIQIGDLRVATVPGEVTTTVGARMKKVIWPNASPRAAVMGLTNGYIDYIATAEEYHVQNYEGGSTLYGSASAQALTEQVSRLARELDRTNTFVESGVLWVEPGRRTSRLLPRSVGNPKTTTRQLLRNECSHDTLVVRWLDVPPGALVPADTAIVVIERFDQRTRAWTLETWDDDPHLEIRALRSRGRAHEWEMRWMPSVFPDRYRVTLGGRTDVPPLTLPETTPCRR